MITNLLLLIINEMLLVAMVNPESECLLIININFNIQLQIPAAVCLHFLLQELSYRFVHTHPVTKRCIRYGCDSSALLHNLSMPELTSIDRKTSSLT